MYRTYRGGRRRMGCLIPTLVILCIIAAIVLFYVQKNLAFTADGMVLKLPFSEKTVTLGGRDPEPPPLVIEEPKPTPAPVTPEPAPQPVEPEKPEYETRIEKSVYVPREVILDPSAFDQLLKQIEGTQINTVVLEVKAEDGKLAFRSAHETAVAAGVNTEDSSLLKAVLTKLQEKKLNIVAQVSCFRDNRAARKVQKLACRSAKKVIWLDSNNITWLNPYIPEAREYIKTIITDVYDLGFKEVMLTNVSFPVRGKTSIIYYSQEKEITKQSAIETFISEINETATLKKDLRISAQFDNRKLKNDPAPGGQTLKAMTDAFYRVYAKVEPLENGRRVDMQVYDGMKAAMGTNDTFPTRFVPILDIGNIRDKTALKALLYSAQSLGTGCMLFHNNGTYTDLH